MEAAESGAAKPPDPNSPDDLFSLLSAFAERMAILSSISEKDKFWEDPQALKVGLAAYGNARYLKKMLTDKMALAQQSHGALLQMIAELEKDSERLEKELRENQKKLVSVKERIVKEEVDQENSGTVSRLRPRAQILETEIDQIEETLVVKRRALQENKNKEERVGGELVKAQTLNNHFLVLFEECFEKWEVFDEGMLQKLSQEGGSAEIREMVREAVESEPGKVINISRTDWSGFQRSLDIFLIQNLQQVTTEVIVLADGTLRKIQARTAEVAGNVKVHIDGGLEGDNWTEIGKLFERWNLARQMRSYQDLRDNVRMYIDPATLERAAEFIAPSMQQRILIGVLEWLIAGVRQGYTSFGKDAGFNTLMFTVDSFYLLYQWHAVPVSYIDSRNAEVFTTVNALHVFELDIVFCNNAGTEIEHNLHEDARKKLREEEVDLRRHLASDGEEGAIG